MKYEMLSLLMAFILLSSYNFFVLIVVGLLPSISESYYEVKNKFIFQWVLFLFPLLILNSVIDHITTYLFPIACFGLLLVPVAPNFKDKGLFKITHFTGAFIGIVFGYIGLWVEFGLWEPLLISLVLIGILYLIIKRKNLFYWVEQIAINVIILSLFYFLNRIKTTV